MNYSSLHKKFAFRLKIHLNINEQDVLNRPEDYFGPNYKEVLNLWFLYDSLSQDQKNVHYVRYWTMDDITHNKANKIARELASEVIDPRFVDHLGEITLELIAALLYIERGISFTFIPLIFDL